MKIRILIIGTLGLLISSILIYILNNKVDINIDKGLINFFSGLLMGVAIVFIAQIIRQIRPKIEKNEL
jgi:hypothetical protein